MSDILKFIGTLIGLSVLVFALAAGAVWIIYSLQYGDYEYIDLDGNKGESNRCYEERGGLFCDLDGGKVKVKQYNLIEDSNGS